MHIELLENERLRLCGMLGLDAVDLHSVFVTFLRRPLTDETRHKRFEHTQRELAEYADALAESEHDLWSESPR